MNYVNATVKAHASLILSSNTAEYSEILRHIRTRNAHGQLHFSVREIEIFFREIPNLVNHNIKIRYQHMQYSSVASTAIFSDKYCCFFNLHCSRPDKAAILLLKNMGKEVIDEFIIIQLGNNRTQGLGKCVSPDK